jgi:hypothetical protein
VPDLRVLVQDFRDELALLRAAVPAPDRAADLR